MGRVLSTPTDTRETRATNAAHTALAGQILLLDTTVSSFTVTLPANPRLGDRINLIDAAGNCGNNKVIVARNGNKIANLAEDLDFDIKNASLELIYTGSAYGWSILSN
jgi:phage tail sheath protein FI